MNTKSLNWLLLIIWMSLIFILSSRSSFGIEMSVTDYKLVSSIAHVFLYSILAWLSIRAFISTGVKTKKALVYGFLLAAIYGLSDEFHQHFVPGREMGLDDWLIDCASALAVVYLYAYRHKIKIIPR